MSAPSAFQAIVATTTGLAVGPGPVLVRVLAAITVGAVFGWDRERKHRPAGLRTFVLISIGSTLASMATVEFAARDLSLSEAITLDPFRILAGLLSAIGFLCAGTIIHSGGNVRGLTTAAGLFLTGVIGMAIGLGLYWMAGVGLIAGLATMTALRVSDVTGDQSHGQTGVGQPHAGNERVGRSTEVQSADSRRGTPADDQRAGTWPTEESKGKGSGNG